MLKGYRILVWEDENVLKVDGGGGLHSNVNVLNATELYT